MEILTGKDKGKQGVVSLVARRKNSVIVEGMNAVRSMVEEKRIYIAVLLICTKCVLVHVPTLILLSFKLHAHQKAWALQPWIINL